VKSFAGKLVDEHQQANDELVKLANSKNVELPAAPPRGKRSAIEKLGKKSGADFDKTYISEVGIKDHKTDIKKFEKASKEVKDPQLKAWVDKTLPHLREHLAMAEKIHGGNANAAASMGNTSGAAKPEVSTATPKGAATGTNTGNKTGS
jgi:putative membrane protein